MKVIKNGGSQVDVRWSMKVGDLVKDNHPSWAGAERIGVIVGRTKSALHNKSFKVLWRDSTIGKNIWDYDLKVVNESR